jgi:hypothetical protein
MALGHPGTRPELDLAQAALGPPVAELVSKCPGHGPIVRPTGRQTAYSPRHPVP